MKKWFAIGVMIGVIISCYYVIRVKTIPPPQPVGTPIALSIPKLGVNAPVEQVGQDAQGLMDVPKNIFGTGWYKWGAKPGERGNAVIDGHVNTPQLKPSVFANLSRLREGDTVRVTDNLNKTRSFKVYSVMDLPSQHFPVETVFGSFGSPNLVLITCSGVYQRYRKDYSSRTVVFSRLLN